MNLFAGQKERPDVKKKRGHKAYGGRGGRDKMGDWD